MDERSGVDHLNRGGQHPSDKHNLVIVSRLPIHSHRQVWHDLVPPCAYRPVRADPIPAEAQAVPIHSAFDTPAANIVVFSAAMSRASING